MFSFWWENYTPTIRLCEYSCHLRIFNIGKSAWTWMRTSRNPRGEKHRPGLRFSSYISTATFWKVQRTMDRHYAHYTFLIFAHLIVLSFTLPTSLVEEIKTSELRNNKGMIIFFKTSICIEKLTIDSINTYYQTYNKILFVARACMITVIVL